jgi:hypothetical protein
MSALDRIISIVIDNINLKVDFDESDQKDKYIADMVLFGMDYVRDYINYDRFPDFLHYTIRGGYGAEIVGEFDSGFLFEFDGHGITVNVDTSLTDIDDICADIQTKIRQYGDPRVQSITVEYKTDWSEYDPYGIENDQPLSGVDNTPSANAGYITENMYPTEGGYIEIQCPHIRRYATVPYSELSDMLRINYDSIKRFLAQVPVPQIERVTAQIIVDYINGKSSDDKVSESITNYSYTKDFNTSFAKYENMLVKHRKLRVL